MSAARATANIILIIIAAPAAAVTEAAPALLAFFPPGGIENREEVGGWRAQGFKRVANCYRSKFRAITFMSYKRRGGVGVCLGSQVKAPLTTSVQPRELSGSGFDRKRIRQEVTCPLDEDGFDWSDYLADFKDRNELDIFFRKGAIL